METGSISFRVEALLTSALGLVAPREMDKVELDTGRRRIDFEVRCTVTLPNCRHCEAPAQHIHDRLRRSSRRLDFFQFESWLHADVPRVACTSCAKTHQASVRCAAVFRCVRRQRCCVALTSNCGAVSSATSGRPALDDMSTVRIVGIDDTNLHRGQSYITVVHDLDTKRLLYATEGHDHQTVVDFATASLGPRIADFYNSVRLHSALGNLPPNSRTCPI